MTPSPHINRNGSEHPSPKRGGIIEYDNIMPPLQVFVLNPKP